ncbi:MAG TPA: alpha amylase C-terminal domain-containing protein [Acidimicrobiales bacterium]|nr:alpha amylase C-terminal domain-containing protein [Acidimicrobiales bacterium]
MALAQTHVTESTPMGATLLPDGATFRFWAPRALHVYLVLNPGATYQPDEADELVGDPGTGHWFGFAPGVTNGDAYLFWVVGEGSSGFKRDPWARELAGSWPQYACVVRALDEYPWHDAGFHPPGYPDLTVYEFHVGVFSAVDDQGNDIRPHRVSKLLDVLDRVEYLADLGVRAVQPLPVVEFRTPSSQGYNGTDIFSPETDYCVADGELEEYLARVNRRLAAKGCAPLTVGQLTGHVNQLKAFVDVLHLYGIAVIFDVVYNHAGGGDLDDQSLDHVDRPASPSVFNNAYFQPTDFFAPVFAFTRPDVAWFLIQNAVMFLTDYHADGLRFDEVGVITDHGGSRFCQDLTSTLRWVKPQALLLAEYWRDPRARAVWPAPDGLGFDAGYSDGLRLAVRSVTAVAATGASAQLDMAGLAASLEKPWGVPENWQVYTYLENHDLQLADPSPGHHQLRMVELGGGVDSGWYAHSRCRVATGLLLTAPGVPALFMGQEFLESRLWSDSPDATGSFIGWDALDRGDRPRVDFLRCTRGLLHLRRQLPALRSDGLHVYHVNAPDRVLAFHRWVPGEGRDVVVVASLREEPFDFGSYRLGFPAPGRWTEVFNTDAFPGYPQQWTRGNPDGVTADGPPMHDLPASAGITIPPNGLLVFAR